MKTWVVGAGETAIEYVKVLQAMQRDFVVVGRGEESARRLREATGAEVVTGGLQAFLETHPEKPDNAINCVRVKDLKAINEQLVDYGVGRILSEKPGIYEPSDIHALAGKCREAGAEVYIAYNRRFYASVLKAEEIIEADGGLLSCNFEFTEWAHVFESMGLPMSEFKYLFLGNSTHVVDLVFFFCGEPRQMASYSSGTTGWHTPSNYAGAGVTEKDVLFSYNANWNAPGRWGVELLTSRHRIYLKPMEQLQLQDKGSVKVYPVEIDDRLDKEYKPGFFLEVKAFLEGDGTRLCTIEEQESHIQHIYGKMAGQQW